MTLLEMFEKVSLVFPLEQRKFFNYFEDSVNELSLLYHDRILFEKDKKYIPPCTLHDELIVRPLFHDPILDNILYKATLNDIYKSEFIRKSEQAYRKYYRDYSKGRRLRRMRW